jgi:hypothetical protein
VYSRLDVHFAPKATELLRGSDDVMGHVWTYMGRKFLFRDNDDRNERTNGEITDPILLMPNNPYPAALNSHRWLAVVGKPQLKDGEIERLYISDLAG